MKAKPVPLTADRLTAQTKCLYHLSPQPCPGSNSKTQTNAYVALTHQRTPLQSSRKGCRSLSVPAVGGCGRCIQGPQPRRQPGPLGGSAYTSSAWPSAPSSVPSPYTWHSCTRQFLFLYDDQNLIIFVSQVKVLSLMMHFLH